jgi:predicted nuclease with TOPRIM domain
LKLKNFENLESRVYDLVKETSELKKENEKIASVLAKKKSESKEIKDSLDKLHKERYQLRSKLDALIKKIEGLERVNEG